MNGSPYKDEDNVILPESVEEAIRRICLDKKQEPLKIYCRRMLSMIGEAAAIDILNSIISSSTPLKSFGGFVSHLVKKNHPLVAADVLKPYNSPHSSPRVSAPSPCISPQKSDSESLQPPLSNGSSDLKRTTLRNISCQLSFEEETHEKRNSGVREKLSHGEVAGCTTISQQLRILNELEFRKLFLVLSYTGRQSLETVVTIDAAAEIRSMKDLPMRDFEKIMWKRYRHKSCAESDRSQFLDWNSGKTHVYYSHVCQDGSYHFKGPYLNSLRNHLQRSLGDDNILIVKFEEGAYDKSKIAKEGIVVGLRRYQFFVFKDERKKARKNQSDEDKKATSFGVKCYFVHIDSISPHAHDENYVLSGKSIGEARRMFMHIHTLLTIEKYMARFSLILSKTRKLELDFAAVIVEIIEDIPFKDENGSIIKDEDGNPILHTDGTGYISEDLAMKCPKDLYSAKYTRESSSEFANFEGTGASNMELPLLIQCRLFHDGYAVKGTLLVNRKLEPGTIQIRPSMIKVSKDQSQTMQTKEIFNSLEIVSTSKKPGRNFLSKYLIALLSYGGVPQDFFLNLLIKALEETRNVYSNKLAAMRVASHNDGLDFGFLAQRMIASGVPLNEPYLQLCLSNMEKGERTKLKEGKITIDESFYLMGTADPTGVLNTDEVCVILDRGQISGKVLVYRNPGLHFGDIHIMEAVYVKELEEVVGNAKYGIFFSVKGHRSAAYEMATGDFDGDRYWVSRNPELLKYYKAHKPWCRVYSAPDSKKKNLQDFTDIELERQLFQLFLDARTPSFSMGIAADSWLAYMDRLLSLGDDRATEKSCLKEKMLKLVDIYYDALDAPKSGKKVNVPEKANAFPHHMEKAPEHTYHSSSILGMIYDTVQEFKNEDVLKKEVWKLPIFYDEEIPEKYVSMWRERYQEYRRDMMEVLKSGDESKNEAADDVIKKYKQMLYEADEMEESAKDSEDIYMEARAIYDVTYEYAMRKGVEKCGFAWKVAGSALCSFHAWKCAQASNERAYPILPSVMREMLNIK